ncbi:MAG: hypothetical protein GY947_19220 [Rhodobacteraceae bacterium]|nr:hypothetical protein [Paracoccaceae bacterium]
MPLFTGLAAALAACSPEEPPQVDKGGWAPEYGMVDTRLLDDELVAIQVQMRGARHQRDVIAFNDCAAAQYALIRGSGFVRRVRNDVTEKRGLWTGDGVYTLSDAHPGGTHTIDAEVAASDCAANNIPMV